jgi:hypothetical protein
MLINLINEDIIAASVVNHGTGTEKGETLARDGECHGQVRGHDGEITDKEIGLWKLFTVPLHKTDNPLVERKRCRQSSCAHHAAPVDVSTAV